MDIDPTDTVSMKFAPITSCDVERWFSRFKSLLTGKNSTMENLDGLFSPLRLGYNQLLWLRGNRQQCGNGARKN
nr:unnamed protein product [Callosobruchus analis]